MKVTRLSIHAGNCNNEQIAAIPRSKKFPAAVNHEYAIEFQGIWLIPSRHTSNPMPPPGSNVDVWIGNDGFFYCEPS